MKLGRNKKKKKKKSSDINCSETVWLLAYCTIARKLQWGVYSQTQKLVDALVK